MMPWSLELEVLAWLCSGIHIEIPHNQLNSRHWDSKSRIFWWFYSYGITSYFIWVTESSASQSSRVVTCSAIFSLKTAKFPILNTYPWPSNHYPCYSSFIIATPSVFGNAHWILKTAPQTSSWIVSTIPLCFCDFPLFYCFLYLT